MKNKGLFSTLFIEDVRDDIKLDDHAKGRMATLTQTWRGRDPKSSETLWNTFMKQALGYLQFVPANAPTTPGVYPLFEDFGFSNCLAVLYLLEPGADIDDVAVGRFWPAKLLRELKQRKLNWGILTDGAQWRLYSTKSARPYEDYVELPLAEALENANESEYALFERFFHKDSFLPEADEEAAEQSHADAAAGVYKCRLDRDGESSEETLQDRVKGPLLYQVDEVLQYLCNGLIADTLKKGAEYTEEERTEIFQSAVKLLYRCLFLFYAEARRLLPSESDKAEKYNKKLSIHSLCEEACKFRWGQRKDNEAYDLWKHLKGLIAAVNTGDPEYGIMGYDGGLFDDAEEKFLGRHKLRNDFLARALYLLAYVEPLQPGPEDEYEIPYADLEVRHLGEMYENILEFAVMLADADRVRRRTKDGVEILLASETSRQKTDTIIKKGDVYFGETALERKQTGSYYTPEPLVRFLNEKAIIVPLRAAFEHKHRKRFDQLLKEALSGYDDAARRGAASSAAALLEQFANETVLPFKACDPAMGSGHFLVDAANQITGLIVELLAEISDVKNLRLRITSNPNHWRRLVTRHCLYGVDLNPLAVTLARLSLWLNCFATDHKLTFLDHHLRCGNSLVGIRDLTALHDIPERREDTRRDREEAGHTQLHFSKQAFAGTLYNAAKVVTSISGLSEDDTDRQRSVFQKASNELQTSLAPLADLHASYLMDNSTRASDYGRLISHFSKGGTEKDLQKDLRAVWHRARDLRLRHHFFHWPIEFPDIFAGGNGLAQGFTATIGNPPWDAIRPLTQEFFSQFDPRFRTYEKQEAISVATRLKEIPSIAQRWGEYEALIEEQKAYFTQPTAFPAVGTGDLNTYKLFLNLFFVCTANGGSIGVLVPSGFYTDEGSKALRILFFEHTQIDSLYCFENRWPEVFPAVHNSFKFVTVSARKGGLPTKFKCAFMQHDPMRLPAIERGAAELSLEMVRKFSPDGLSIMEFPSTLAARIAVRAYDGNPLLGDAVPDTWNFQVNRELHMSGDSHLFRKAPPGYPLYEGKMILAFDHQFLPPSHWVSEKDARDFESRRMWARAAKRQKQPKRLDLDEYRVAYRSVAASTNERTFVSTILPPRVITPHSMQIVRRRAPREPDGLPVDMMGSHHALFLASCLNSFVCDFLLRMKVTINLSEHLVTSLPIPRLGFGDPRDSQFFWPIVARAIRLTCTTDEYASLWEEVFPQIPRSVHALTTVQYGPEHERQVRQSLATSADSLTKTWTPSCAVHDRLPDRRDTGDRAQLRAEIDALVAHLYGLAADEFAYVIDTFPGVQSKETRAFGEFQSKRKCLEEYDRLAR